MRVGVERGVVERTKAGVNADEQAEITQEAGVAADRQSVPAPDRGVAGTPAPAAEPGGRGVLAGGDRREHLRRWRIVQADGVMVGAVHPSILDRSLVPPRPGVQAVSMLVRMSTLSGHIRLLRSAVVAGSPAARAASVARRWTPAGQRQNVRPRKTPCALRWSRMPRPAHPSTSRGVQTVLLGVVVVTPLYGVFAGRRGKGQIRSQLLPLGRHFLGERGQLQSGVSNLIV